MRLVIEEEYGYRWYFADLTDAQYEHLLRRWETIKGLNCLVPVTLIVPEAREVEHEELIRFLDTKQPYIRCHIHEADDSYLEGTPYRGPEADCFWMEGVKYAEYR